MLRCQDGDPEAFEPLVRFIERALLAMAAAILKDAAAGEDAFVEAMARVLPRIREVEPDAFMTYARRAVRNAAVDIRRSRNHRDNRKAMLSTESLARRTPWAKGAIHELVPDQSVSPEDSMLKAERKEAVQSAVRALREPNRSIVRAFYEEGLTHSEIASRHKMSASTVKRHLRAARLTLAARLRPPEVQHDA